MLQGGRCRSRMAVPAESHSDGSGLNTLERRLRTSSVKTTLAARPLLGRDESAATALSAAYAKPLTPRLAKRHRHSTALGPPYCSSFTLSTKATVFLIRARTSSIAFSLSSCFGGICPESHAAPAFT